MLNEIITGIAVELDSLFGYPVHVDSIKQDLDAPCFLIKAVTASAITIAATIKRKPRKTSKQRKRRRKR